MVIVSPGMSTEDAKVTSLNVELGGLKSLVRGR
jgi:hypothetical protein